MLTLDIPLFNCAVYMYSKKERVAFEEKYDCSVRDSHAMVCGNGIWLGDGEDDVGVCYHEASHLTDWLLEDHLEMAIATLDSTGELRAYVLQYLGNKIIEYTTSLKTQAGV